MKDSFHTQIALVQKRIAPYIQKTPLIRVKWLESELGNPGEIYFKLENRQLTNSFKPRGAFNALLRLDAESQRKGVVCRSSGNFAQAVSYATQKLGIQATIVMPENAPTVKVEATKKYGAKVIQSGATHAQGQAVVDELATKQTLSILHPYDMLDVIHGQATVAAEIFDELPSMGTFICQVGGGGLMGGCAAYFKSVNPKIEIIGVEPEGANDFYISFYAKTRIFLESPNTIADGLKAQAVGKYNWPLLIKNVDSVELVSDESIKKAMVLVKEKMGEIVEPSAVVGMAGFLALSKERRQSFQYPLVFVMSGGNA